MQFGTKAGENVREDIKRSSGGGDWLKTVQDGKDLRVRFLQDPEDWYKFQEHYSDETKFFPCTQNNECPGCNSANEKMRKRSRRYAANVLDVKEGKVVALKLPLDLANRVTNKCDRNNGTLLDRDLTLIRSGKGLDTTYDVEMEDRQSLDLSRYELMEIEPMLANSFAEAFGTAKLEEVADAAQKRAEEEKPPF